MPIVCLLYAYYEVKLTHFYSNVSFMAKNKPPKLNGFGGFEILKLYPVPP